MRTREEARVAWAEGGLTVADLTFADLADLRATLNLEMRASGLIRGSLRMEGRVKTRTQSGRIIRAELRCRSDYFTVRQAATFERDGFFGFAGWADKVNVQPVLNGFCTWARDLAARRIAA